MSIPDDLIAEYPGLGEWCILHAFRGSLAAGMFVPSIDPNSIDDKDTMAICVPPMDYYYGLKQFGSRGTQEIKRGEWDIVVYEARKALSLLAEGNPNVLSMLWLEEKDYIHVTNAGKLLLANRDLFVGKHVYRSFIGYAYGQLHRMEHFVFEGYMGTKRKQLVERLGYDAKNAAHCIRILRMGIEFLNEGRLYVNRPDAAQLLEIKRGEWTLEQVKAEADKLFQEAWQAYEDSKLPDFPDKEGINQLCTRIVHRTLIGRRAQCP